MAFKKLLLNAGGNLWSINKYLSCFDIVIVRGHWGQVNKIVDAQQNNYDWRQIKMYDVQATFLICSTCRVTLNRYT